MTETRPAHYKIARNGEAFWISNVREIEPGIYAGLVANDLTDSRCPFGAVIAFVDAEISPDTWESGVRRQ
jgi:hypothetical protein